MDRLNIMTFNINGLKSFAKYHQKSIESLNSSLNTYLSTKNISIACFQETRGSKETLKEFYTLRDYHGIFNHCKGNPNRSGVCIFIKRNLFYSKVLRYDDIEVIKDQGRILMLEMDKYLIFNVYFPFDNSSSDNEDIKKFYMEIEDIVVKESETGRKIIICGDFNATYRLSDNFMYSRAQISTKIDEVTPKLFYNDKLELKYIFPTKSTLEDHFYLRFQRIWLKNLILKGFTDSFIYSNKNNKNIFTCWNKQLNLRQSNLGSRIDYILVSESLKEDIVTSQILTTEQGSDHCPVLLTILIKKEYFSNKINLLEKTKKSFSFFNLQNKKKQKVLSIDGNT